MTEEVDDENDYYPEVCIGGWSCVCQPYIESANELAEDLILVHRVQLKPHKSQEEWYLSGITDVAFTSLYSEKTHLKKCAYTVIVVITRHAKVSGVMFPVLASVYVSASAVADGVLADAILIISRPPIPPTNIRKVRGP